MDQKTLEELSFEQALDQLEKTVQVLEQNDVDLDQALDQYQRGVALAKICQEKLEKAEKSLTKIVNDQGEEVPFDRAVDLEADGGKDEV